MLVGTLRAGKGRLDFRAAALAKRKAELRTCGTGAGTACARVRAPAAPEIGQDVVRTHVHLPARVASAALSGKAYLAERAEAKEKERTWLKNQLQGELDDARLVDGATGERNVYKRRGQPDDMFRGQQR